MRIWLRLRIGYRDCWRSGSTCPAGMKPRENWRAESTGCGGRLNEIDLEEMGREFFTGAGHLLGVGR